MSGPEFQFLIHVELLEHLFKERSRLQVVVFATICWCLWERQNQIRVRQTSWQIHKIEGRAKMMVCEFWDDDQEQQRSVRRPQARWSPPPTGTYKANFNVALFEELHCAGLGAVYRDHSSQVIAALSQRIGLPHTVEMAEALEIGRAHV